MPAPAGCRGASDGVYEHVPVLRREVVTAMGPKDDEVFVDCTLGGGGHSEAILQAAECRVVGIDCDPAAITASRERLQRFGDRFAAVRARFSELARVLDDSGLDLVDGVLADVGVSSPQLDDGARGFSFSRTGPIDMRMDPDGKVCAADLVNHWSAEDLAEVIRRFGEERHARRVARTIVAGRPWNDTRALADTVAKAVGRVKGRIHPATRTFQALRIAVNNELGELRALLPVAVERLRPGGRLAVVSFHSLEDRIVKQFIARETGRTAERDPWGNPIGPVRLVARPPVTPASDDPNPRARSARLRTAVRLPWNTR
ncbi:MAG: 16S rRNA (cytosine(1402)-N(4))-methyltransferase RsmH [Deltaproteobacteria bacterium]|nr:16S rRNA (cytosine(1402)-N(4))-methyltransferase RsmH [Deltaproteobacteria bacterium]